MIIVDAFFILKLCLPLGLKDDRFELDVLFFVDLILLQSCSDLLGFVSDGLIIGFDLSVVPCGVELPGGDIFVDWFVLILGDVPCICKSLCFVLGPVLYARFVHPFIGLVVLSFLIRDFP